MCQDITAQLLLLLLNEFDVGEHALRLEPLGELKSSCCIQVQTSQGDQLKNKAETFREHMACRGNTLHIPFLPELPYEVLQSVVGEAFTNPVEAWAQVIHEHPVRVLLLNLPCKRFGLFQVGTLRLEPRQVGVRGKSQGSLDGSVDASGVMVVTLTSLWS